MAKKPKKPARPKQPYAIGEWFGRDYALTTNDQRRGLVNEAKKARSGEVCRFRESFPAMAPRLKGGKLNSNCTKPGGVCCLRQLRSPNADDLQYGPLVTTCPVRFSEGGIVFKHIAREVLGTPQWKFAKEIDFLNPDVAQPIFLASEEARAVAEEAQEASADDGTTNPPDVAGKDADAGQQSADDEEGARSVGRIDMVLAGVGEDQMPTGEWCAVELQAVYFQGAGMAGEWASIQKQLDQTAEPGGTRRNDVPPPPAGNRRPDFRSSGPKRLLPQLQIKVPSLRRWGKKMAVVVDASFFSTFGPMERTDHVSNADIIWCVVVYEKLPETSMFALRVAGTYMTTLEEAVVGLTAGKPRSKPDFEASLLEKMGEEVFQSFTTSIP